MTSRSAHWLILLMVGALILAIFSAFVGSKMSSPAQIAADAKPPRPSIPKVRVRFGVLKATATFRAEVDDSTPISVGVPKSIGDADPIVTAMNVHRGQVVSEGDVVMSVATRPVFVLKGKIPAFRDMALGARGPDVKQLKAALRRLGFYSGTDPGRLYGKATVAAVKSLYRHAEYRSTNGGVVHGEVVFVPTLPQRILSVAVHVGGTAGATGNGDTGNGDTGSALVTGDAGSTSVVSIGSGNVLLRGSVDSVSASVLKKGMNGIAISETRGKSFRVRVRSLSAGSNSDQGGGADQVNVTLKPVGHFDQKLLGENVGVSVTASSTHTKTLIVPVAAVVTRADGTSVITVVNDRDQTRLVRVKPGLVEKGEIAVAPLVHSALSASDWVAVSKP